MRVVIADDEEIIRMGIVELIPWNQLDCEVIGQAEDGEEALTLIEEYKPEIVITDIKMPFITGLELLKKIKDKYEPLYTILLTGYDEFKFAQEAVNNGAYAYLLKPVDPDELVQILTEIKANHEKKSAAKSLVKELRTEMSLKKALYGLENTEEIRELLSEYGFQDENLFFSTFIFEIDDYILLSRTEYADWIKSVKTFIYYVIKNETGMGAHSVIAENNGFTFISIVWEDNMKQLTTRHKGYDRENQRDDGRKGDQPYCGRRRCV